MDNSIILSAGAGVHYLSEIGWSKFMSNLHEGRVGFIAIWGAGKRIWLYIEPTHTAGRYMVHGDNGTEITWLSNAGIKLIAVVDRGAIIDEDNLDDILDVVASMNHNYVIF